MIRKYVREWCDGIQKGAWNRGWDGGLSQSCTI